MKADSKGGGVQSVERAFDLIARIAGGHDAVGLSQLATDTGLPLPTIHRLLQTLVKLGYIRQDAARRYALGPRFIPLGEAAMRSLGEWSLRHLRELANLAGESANLAVLEGTEVLYVAQVPGRHAMRMFTEPGRRVLPHCTAVGKAMLSRLPEQRVRTILERGGMPKFTPATITDPDEILAQLATIREQGFAVDEGEQEVGVRCVAVPIPEAPTLSAVSVSGPLARLTDEVVMRIAPLIARAALAIACDVGQETRP